MASTVFLTRDFTHYVQLESTYGTSPGALAGTDAFKCQTGYPFERTIARMDRDKDSGPSASVLSTQAGRQSSSWTIEGDLIPSGNSTTPTPPDMDPFFEAHFGQKHTCTAHTTTAAGSVGVTLNLAVGGGAASGLAVGDLFAVDVSTAVGYEVRRAAAVAGDVVTMDRALTADPVAGRTVKTGTTYKFLSSVAKSLHLWAFLKGNNFRHKAGGCLSRTLGISCDFGEDTPHATVNFAGDGSVVEETTQSEPTAATTGLPLVPLKSYVWLDADKHCLNNVEVTSDNGLELRANTSCSMVPTGAKRTGNGGRFDVKLSITLHLTTGTVEDYYDDAPSLTPYDTLVQLGADPGYIVGMAFPKYIPDGPPEDIDGEVGLKLDGRAYGTSGDDEFYLAFI